MDKCHLALIHSYSGDFLTDERAAFDYEAATKIDDRRGEHGKQTRKTRHRWVPNGTLLRGDYRRCCYRVIERLMAMQERWEAMQAKKANAGILHSRPMRHRVSERRGGSATAHGGRIASTKTLLT
jgi:hypothetical protein